MCAVFITGTILLQSAGIFKISSIATSYCRPKFIIYYRVRHKPLSQSLKSKGSVLCVMTHMFRLPRLHKNTKDNRYSFILVLLINPRVQPKPAKKWKRAGPEPFIHVGIPISGTWEAAAVLVVIMTTNTAWGSTAVRLQGPSIRLRTSCSDVMHSIHISVSPPNS